MLHSFWCDGFSYQERAELLKRWVQSGENMQSCEHQIITSRKANINAKRKLSLISVKDMGKPPHNFSELLGLQLRNIYNLAPSQYTETSQEPVNHTYHDSGKKLPISLQTSRASRLLICRLIAG